MSELPAPLVSAEVDLRAFDWFPFYHKRLRQSSFWKRASDLACRISVDFWAEAFEQVPAGSLPEDDYILAEWAGFGRRNLDGWLVVKDEVMSAWTRCSDNRWYHPTLCEVARKQWSERQLHQWERECDRIRKANGRREKDGLKPLPLPPKPSQGYEASGGTADASTGHPSDLQGIPGENALKGKGKGKGKEDKISSSLRSEDSSPAVPATGQSPEPSATRLTQPPRKQRKHVYPPDAFASWYAKYPRKQAISEAEKAFRKIVTTDDTPFDELMVGIDRFWLVQSDLTFWPHPASWLNKRRWLDEPTKPQSGGRAHSDGTGEPPLDFGGGVKWPKSTVCKQVEKWRSDPTTWPEGTLGPPPGSPGCRVPERLLEAA